MERFIVITALFVVTISGVPLQNIEEGIDAASCALKACHEVDPHKINVHLVPHSHDDVGWLKTVEEYFWGLKDGVHNVGIDYIFDSTLQALQQNSDRRFIQVETAYFWKWWTKQTQSKRDLYKRLVDNGIIEMVGGGWSMNDEACVSYPSTINQFTWGLRLLNDTLGECGRPKIGWQIDPFGHSREQAWIFKQMGYDAIFFTRLSEDDRKQRKSTKDLEFMWKSNDNFENSEIFTSIMDGYFSPSDFCWDYLQCNSDAINDDPESFDYNLDKKVQEFSEHIANYSTYFRTNNILYTMGGDFQYQAAEINFLNIDKLIKGFKSLNSSYNVFYSTPSCYLQAVKAANATFSVKKSGDFFPYNENNHTYWSGYFTSRSTLKRFERTGNNILQAAQQLNAFGKIKKIFNSTESEENIRKLREAVATMQHHDAITGTEKEKVAGDYSRILTEAIADTEKTIGKIIGNLLKYDNVTEDVTLPLSTCLLTNISVCENTMNKDRSLIVVYNPLAKYITYQLRVPVSHGTYLLKGPYGIMDSEVIQHMKYPVEYPFNKTDYELNARDEIPPMGMKVYYLQKISNKATVKKPKILKDGEIITVERDESKVTYDPQSRKLGIIKDNKYLYIAQDFMFYVSNNGTGPLPGSGDNITSGAYVFRPTNGSAAVKIDNPFQSEVMYIKGRYHDEVIEKVCDYIVQTIRIYPTQLYVEYDWVVGPLDNNTVNTSHLLGKEIIVRYSVQNVTHKTFFTDSNGRQMIERTRTNYPYNDSRNEPVASNYYPVTTTITIKNESDGMFLSVITDRPQGGTSLKDGQIELMIHRRTLMDDHKGLEESLEEMEYGNYIVTRGTHYLVTDYVNVSRVLAVNKLTQPWVLVADATSEEMSLENLQKKIQFKWLGLTLTVNNYTGLLPNLNVLNFEPWKDDTYLIRLEHIFEKNEDENFSKATSVEMRFMFSPYVMDSIRELNLAANTWINGTITGDNYNVTMRPMEIRTFAVTFKPV